MNSTGIIRNLDELGRVVIPKEVRKKLNISVKDPMELYLDGDAIILKRVESGCIFCNNTQDVIPYKDKLICLNCLEEILKLSPHTQDCISEN